MNGGAWWAAVHGVAKSRARLSDFTLTFHFHTLEKEMATHSSVLAWRIPGTAEPGGLRRVRHDSSDLAAAVAAANSGARGNLLHDAGSSHLVSVTTERVEWSGRWDGGSAGSRPMHTYGWFMRHAAETNTILWSNSLPAFNVTRKIFKIN